MHSQETKPLLLVFPFGYLSHYLRCLVLAKHLSRRFEIRFLHHDKFENFVAKAGFQSFHCTAPNAEQILQKVKAFDFSWLNEHDLETLYLAQVAAINSHDPVAILGDAMPALKMAAEKCAVTYVSLINGYMSNYYSRVRTLSVTHPGHRYLEKLPAVLKNCLTIVGETAAFRQVHKPFKALRKKHNLQTTSRYLDEWEGDLSLIPDLPELFPQKPLPANILQLPPLIYDEDQSPEEQVVPDASRKTLFVTMGSTGNWEEVTFLNDPVFSKFHIVTAGDSQKLLAAPHIHSLSFVSARAILPHTDLVICHGGNGTIYQALKYKVPLLCSPAHFEQEWNVQAITEAGVGKALKTSATIDVYMEQIESTIMLRQDSNLDLLSNQLNELENRLSKTAEQIADIIITKQSKQYRENLVNTWSEN